MAVLLQENLLLEFTVSNDLTKVLIPSVDNCHVLVVSASVMWASDSEFDSQPQRLVYLLRVWWQPRYKGNGLLLGEIVLILNKVIDKSACLCRDSPREIRNKAEKQRRDKFNQSIAELASMVPPVVYSAKKIDKIGVLRYTAHFLRAHEYGKFFYYARIKRLSSDGFSLYCSEDEGLLPLTCFYCTFWQPYSRYSS